MSSRERFCLLLAAMLVAAACGSVPLKRQVRPEPAAGGEGGEGLSPIVAAGSGSPSGGAADAAGGAEPVDHVGAGGAGGLDAAGGAIESGGAGGQGSTTEALLCASLPEDAGESSDADGAAVPKLPALSVTCPELVTGEATIAGSRVQLWAGPAASENGPLYFYYPTAMTQSLYEAPVVLGSDLLDEVTSNGGLIASPFTSAGGASLGDIYWGENDIYWGENDLDVADAIVACAASQRHIDPTRIFAVGTYTGASFAGLLALRRSDYIASLATVSGGIVQGTYPEPQNPSHVPPLYAAHAVKGIDLAGWEWGSLGAEAVVAFTSKCGFAVECGDEMGNAYTARWNANRAAFLQFLIDHPYDVSPEPYQTSIPQSFPDYCRAGCPTSRCAAP